MSKIADIGLEGTQHVKEYDRNPVLGAIVGDIVGSKYEFNNHKSKDFKFIDNDSFFTDDTVHTLAIYKAVRESKDLDEFKIKAKKYLVDFTLKYPKMTYGLNFIEWINKGANEPYGSYGNGSAMRVSGISKSISSASDVYDFSYESAKITHNHDEGTKGAVAVAMICHHCYWLDYNKEEIKNFATTIYPEIERLTVSSLMETYEYSEACQDTVPQAIVCFLESTDFEDAIRNAISIGGDSDTLAAITGSIAAAYYGVPELIKKRALKKLDDFLLNVYIG